MFFAACEGYFDKLEDTAVLFRNLASIVNRSMGGNANMSSVWPLFNDSEVSKNDIMKPFTKAELDELTRIGNAQFAKIKSK